MLNAASQVGTQGSWAGFVSAGLVCAPLCSWFSSMELIPFLAGSHCCAHLALWDSLCPGGGWNVSNTGLGHHRRAENASFPGCLYQWVREPCSVHGSQGAEITTLNFFFFSPLVPLEDVAPLRCLHLSFCCSFSPAHLAVTELIFNRTSLFMPI